MTGLKRGRLSLDCDVCASPDHATGSAKSLGKPTKIVGGHREGELPIDLGQAAISQLAQAGHRLGSAEGLPDVSSNALGDRVAGVLPIGYLVPGVAPIWTNWQHNPGAAE
jgi:hypothetical protein